jgi:renalase
LKTTPKRIAIIGAGLSGLVLARALAPKAQVQIFEKARGVGGRMSTRYAEPFFFDHGAQCFTARTPEFRKFLEPYLAQGTVAEWSGKVVNLELGKKPSRRLWSERHLVAAPNMNSLCKILSKDLMISCGTEIAPLSEHSKAGWQLKDIANNVLGHYDWVIATAPPAQVEKLFHAHLPAAAPIRRTRLTGCYALMLGFNRPWREDWIAAKIRNNPLKWLSVNSSKPARDQRVTCLVAHSRNSWAERHIDMEVAAAEALLLKELQEVTGIDPKQADFIATHRWRYAIVDRTLNSGTYCDPALGLAATGDWAGTSRLEEVWHHATQLARLIESHR